MINFVASNAYLETAVNEIQAFARNAIAHIDIAMKSLELELIDYREHTISLNSAEGIAILDRWAEFWGSVLRGLAQHTQFIQSDLSGGFDSRVGLLVALHSGIDLNRIRISSNTDGLNTHKEDYAIASQIVAHYGFKLNQPLPTRQSMSYSLTDAWNAELYHQQTFRILPTMFGTSRGVDKLYYLKGLGGETIRDNWHMTPNEFIEREIRKVNSYPRTMAHELSHSIETILKSGFRFVRDKYKIAEDSADIPQYFHIERYRNHHGKEAVGNYLKLEQDFSTVHNDAQIITKLAPYLTARVDVKLRVEGDFQILNVSDDRAKITKPTWFQNNGVGYVITSYVGKLAFTAKASVDGKILLGLKGIRDKSDRKKNIPYWIDYTKLTVNDKTLFDALKPARHNKPYSCNIDVKAGEELKIQVEWLPHRSDT